MNRSIGSSAEHRNGAISATFADVAEYLNNNTLFLLSRIGPVHFSIKEESSSIHKVLLGNPHQCTCKESRTLGTCMHIAFVILKVLRVPIGHALAAKLGYSDLEMTQALNADWDEQRRPEVIKRPLRPRKNLLPGNEPIAHRQILSNEEGALDICPICQDDMMSEQPLTWCRKGCGANIHARCMQTFAQYKISNNEKVACPLCREPWDITLLREDCKGKGGSRRRCASVSCHNCLAQQKGLFYRCCECSNTSYLREKAPVDFCSSCFARLLREHSTHHLVSTDASVVNIQSYNWFGVPNPLVRSATLAQPDFIQSLQNRELTNNDFDLLLNLDVSRNSVDLACHLTQSLPPVTPSTSTISCLKCTCSTSSSSGMKRLPCGHCLCSPCLQEMIRIAMGSNTNTLHTIVCPDQACQSKIFPGLSRERRKVKVADETGTENEAKMSTSGGKTAGVFGVSGRCLLPFQSRLTADHTGSTVDTAPLPAILSYRQRNRLEKSNFKSRLLRDVSKTPAGADGVLSPLHFRLRSLRTESAGTGTNLQLPPLHISAPIDVRRTASASNLAVLVASDVGARRIQSKIVKGGAYRPLRDRIISRNGTGGVQGMVPVDLCMNITHYGS